MMSSGSTVLRFDFDIFSIEPISIASPVEASTARRSLPAPSTLTSAGIDPFAVRGPVGLVHHHALREQARERLLESGMARHAFMARVKKRL